MAKASQVDLAKVVPIKDNRQTHLERNLDQNIFLSSQTRHKSFVFEVPIELDDGTGLTRYIVIGKTDPFEGQNSDRPSGFDPAKVDRRKGAGVLTTSHFKMIAALLADWEDRGRPQETVSSFSAYQILTRYFNYDYQNIGEAVYKLHRKLLTELHSIPIWFIDCYETVDENGNRSRHTYKLQVLSEFELFEKLNKNGQTSMAISLYKLDGRTLQNLLGGNTRPILLKPLIRKKGDAAVLLYRFCNSVLTETEKFEITTIELFRQLAITGRAYQARADRKRLLERAVKENEGERVVGGKLHFNFAETADRKDYKLIIQKQPVTEIAVEEEQLITQDLLPDETKDIPADKVPHYHFLKQHGIAYAYKVIFESPHSAEVMELINQEWLEKLNTGFVFEKNPKAWLVAAYRNAQWQPYKKTKSQVLNEQKENRLLQQSREKQLQLVELKAELQECERFLVLAESEQLKVLQQEQKGSYFLKYRRWPNDSEQDRQDFEQQCREMLPQITAERQEQVEKIKLEIEQLVREISALNKSMNSDKKV